MKIIKVETTALRIPLKEPYYWSRGVLDAAETVLIAVHTDEGVVGYGEAMAAGAASATQALLAAAGQIATGRDPSAINALLADIHASLFAARGNLSGRRFAATMLAGFDMALWDIAGKAANRPLHALLGGAVRARIAYFGFPQGKQPEQIARDAKAWAESGSAVIYVKVGRGDALDREIVRQVRAAIGDCRLRLDANEAWDVLTADRMIRAFGEFDVEFVEQPTPSDSLLALKNVRSRSAIPIAADQIVYSPEDVLAVCREEAADLIVLGLHESGGLSRFRKCAAIAEAAGINICLHGLYETGITTCATLHAGAVIANLDDGNQYMNHLLTEDIVQGTSLRLARGCLALPSAPGLGFELDWDAVHRADERSRMHRPEG